MFPISGHRNVGRVFINLIQFASFLTHSVCLPLKLGVPKVSYRVFYLLSKEIPLPKMIVLVVCTSAYLSHFVLWRELDMRRKNVNHFK